MPEPTVILVGGFLGVGKTTLILAAAKLLAVQGVRVAAIMNDQDSDLVDTRFSEASHLPTREVVGGCFCCRFSNLLDAADELRSYNPDIIFAEPVGSCIDLSATIIQPLKAHYRVAPLTVLIDPGMSKTSNDIRYLMENQISEADIVCSTKADLYPGNNGAEFSVSSKIGDGVQKWLDVVISGGRIAGSQLLKVDYSRYAEAEAALGWLNFHADLELDEPVCPAMLAGPLMETIKDALLTERLELAHLKVFCQAPTGFIKASACSNTSPVQVDGDLIADPAVHHELAINLRAIADPQRLSTIVTRSLKTVHGRLNIRHQSSFRPAPPVPQYRFTAVV